MEDHSSPRIAKVEKKEEDTKRDRMKYALVVGLGGGSDAQVAYSVSQYLESNQQDWCVAYATCKGVSSSPRVYSIEAADYSADFLNEKNAKGVPRWVGTTLMESTIPQKQLTFEGQKSERKTLQCPLIFEIADEANQSAMETFIVATFDGITPARGWDAVIGVDSGGDVVGGLEDARDRQMLGILQRLVERQAEVGLEKPRFELMINGLCVDGENYFWQMTDKMHRLVESGAFKRREDVDCIRQWLEPVVQVMELSKTPRIILSAKDGQFPCVAAEEEIEDISVENKQVMRATSRATCAGVLATETDAFGQVLGSFVQLPQRHHRLKDGSLPPSVVVPLRWVTGLYSFDAYKFAHVFPHTHVHG